MTKSHKELNPFTHPDAPSGGTGWCVIGADHLQSKTTPEVGALLRIDFDSTEVTVAFEWHSAMKGWVPVVKPDLGQRNIETVSDEPQPVHVADGYYPLFAELVHALDQSQGGKGKERHASHLPFVDQPTMTFARLNGFGGLAQQVMKKTHEAVKMAEGGNSDKAIHEMHGAIVYSAALAILMRERKKDKKGLDRR